MLRNLGGKGDLLLPNPKLCLDYYYLPDERVAPVVIADGFALPPCIVDIISYDVPRAYGSINFEVG